MGLCHRDAPSPRRHTPAIACSPPQNAVQLKHGGVEAAVGLASMGVQLACSCLLVLNLLEKGRGAKSQLTRTPATGRKRKMQAKKEKGKSHAKSNQAQARVCGSRLKLQCGCSARERMHGGERKLHAASRFQRLQAASPIDLASAQLEAPRVPPTPRLAVHHLSPILSSGLFSSMRPWIRRGRARQA